MMVCVLLVVSGERLPEQTTEEPKGTVPGSIAEDVRGKVLTEGLLAAAEVGKLCLLLLEGLHDFGVALVLHG